MMTQPLGAGGGFKLAVSFCELGQRGLLAPHEGRVKSREVV